MERFSGVLGREPLPGENGIIFEGRGVFENGEWDVCGKLDGLGSSPST